MQKTHRLTTVADNGDEVVMTCPESSCGRRIVVKRAGGLVVLDQGDFSALHTGGTPDVRLTASVS